MATTSFGAYLRDIRRKELLSMEEERELGRRIRAGDEEAVHELVVGNLRFVVKIAGQYKGRRLDLEELVAEGTVGLYEAARRLDERRGCRFVTYAVWWIRRTLTRALERERHLVRFPRGRRPSMLDVVRAEDVLARRLERPPRREEVARELETTPRKVESAIASVRRSSMLTDTDDPLAGDRVDRLPAPNASVPDHVERSERKEDIRAAVATLGERERNVLDLYFGLSTHEPCTLAEIGGTYGLSKERIRQLKDRALARLRTDRLREHLPGAV